jgi:hypothetical protein
MSRDQSVPFFVDLYVIEDDHDERLVLNSTTIALSRAMRQAL